jgi:hypothetical protein
MTIFDRCYECGSIIEFIPYRKLKSLFIKFIDVVPKKRTTFHHEMDVYNYLLRNTLDKFSKHKTLPNVNSDTVKFRMYHDKIINDKTDSGEIS